MTLCLLICCGLRGAPSTEFSRNIYRLESAKTAVKSGTFEDSKRFFDFNPDGNHLKCTSPRFGKKFFIDIKFRVGDEEVRYIEKINDEFMIPGIDGIVTKDQLIALVGDVCGDFSGPVSEDFRVFLGDSVVDISGFFYVDNPMHGAIGSVSSELRERPILMVTIHQPEAVARSRSASPAARNSPGSPRSRSYSPAAASIPRGTLDELD